jgi:predicted alpha/beta-fold hydrolase
LSSSYRAPWWLPGGHAQTIYAALHPLPPIPLRRERWDTPDDDFVDVDWAGEAKAAQTLVLFHGLEGSSASHYARAIARETLAAGWRIAIVHFRGCSGEPNRHARAYHSGDSDEADWILRRIAQEAPVLAAGVSLGGNVLLKWLGERGDDAKRLVRRAAAVSAPIDLGAADRALSAGVSRAIYARMFLRTLQRKSIAKLERHPGIFDAGRAMRARTLYEFDDAVTAPLHGFAGAEDYYARSSAGPLLSGVRVPTLLLNAMNDPFLPREALLRASRDASPSVQREFPETGGHVGFPGGGTWLAKRILGFLSES